jgi:hypothetical protein
MTCQFCEEPIPEGVAICPRCGKPQMQGDSLRGLGRFAFGVVLVAIIMVLWNQYVGFRP